MRPLSSPLYPWPDSSVVRASGISPEGPGFKPQSGHFGKISDLNSYFNSVFTSNTSLWIPWKFIYCFQALFTKSALPNAVSILTGQSIYLSHGVVQPESIPILRFGGWPLIPNTLLSPHISFTFFSPPSTPQQHLIGFIALHDLLNLIVGLGPGFG